ncbi:MAG: histidine phosphatase family protein [Pirellulaceae bacterium]
MSYSPAPASCLTFLVRHAATANNLASPPRIQGSGEDVALSADGRAQAARTARFLADQPITAAFASPLQRALETATIVAQPHRVIPTVIPALQEADVGRWEGRTWVEIESTEPEAYRRFVHDPARHGYAGGENFRQVQQRVLPAVMELMQHQLGSLILIVGHNIVNRVLLATLLDVPLAKARGIDQDNCGINVIRYRPGLAKVLTMNAAFHLT